MSSIDKKELEKFDKVSHTWWNEQGEFGILHKINPIRIQYIIDKITLHFKLCSASFSKVNILDIGCGGGLIAVPLAKLGFNVTAIDALEGNINTAVDYSKKNKLSINYLKSTIEELSTKKKYDVVLCLEVAEHVDNLTSFMLNLVKFVKPSGMAIISTINRTKKAYLFGIVAAEYILKWVPKSTHDYNKFIKPSEFYELLKDTDISIKELKGLTYDIFSDQWKLSNDIDVNYFMYLNFS